VLLSRGRDTAARHNGVFDDNPTTAGLRSVPCARSRPASCWALDVFNAAARQITLGDVERYLGQLRNHLPRVRVWALRRDGTECGGGQRGSARPDPARCAL
jgi:hypothetical protein